MKSQSTRGKVKMEFNVGVRMRDGVRLSADIYRPDSKGKFPALVIRTPYDNTQIWCVESGRTFGSQDYATVIEDMRGRYDSEGNLNVYDHTDVVDTIRWIYDQHWSNGRAGLLGVCASVHEAAVASLNKHLTCMFFVSSMHPNLYSSIYRQGAFLLHWALPWTIIMAGRTQQRLSLHFWPKLYPHLPLITATEAAGYESVLWKEWIDNHVYNNYWRANTAEKKFAQVTTPILHITGWYDFVLQGAIETWWRIAKNARMKTTKQNQRLFIGPWDHRTVLTGSTKVGDMDFGPNAKSNIFDLQLKWYNRWLKDDKNEIENDSLVKIFIMGDNVWRNEKEWPLARTRYTKFFFHSGGNANTLEGDGFLNAKPPEEEPFDKYVYDPANPVSTAGGPNWPMGFFVRSGPYDQRPVEKREDVLIYTTSKLDNDMEVTGPITLKLYASSRSRNTDFTAKLVDVHPNGYAQIIQDGIVRASFRESIEKEVLIEPDKIYEYTIDLWSTSNVFKKGHHIRVEISSSNFPKYDRNLNTGQRFGRSSKIMTTKQRIYHDRKYPSHILLPIIPSEEN